MTVRERDNGAQQLLQLVRQSGRVKTGVIGSEAATAHSEGQTVVDIATIHEFGLGNVPRRSFIRDKFDEDVEKNKRRLRNIAKQIFTGKTDLKTALELFGLTVVGEIQERISDRIDPPLSQETIDRKRSDVPLIHTGQLRTSITYTAEVVRD